MTDKPKPAIATDHMLEEIKRTDFWREDPNKVTFFAAPYVLRVDREREVRKALSEACEKFLLCLPPDMQRWRDLGMDTSKLTLARTSGMAALAFALSLEQEVGK